MSSADEIRAKRLAKLAASALPVLPALPAFLDSSASTTASIPLVPVPTKVETSVASAAGVASAAKQTSSTSVSTQSTFTSGPVSSPVPAKIAKVSLISKEVQLSKWLEYQLEEIFQVTINPAKSSEFTFLQSLSSEVNDTTPPKLLNKQYLDSIFMEVLSETGVPNGDSLSSFEYLFKIYLKIFQFKRILNKRDEIHDLKLEIYNEIIQYLSSFGLICFQEEDLFINNQSIEKSIKFIVSTLSQQQTEILNYLSDIINKSNEQESLLEFLNVFFSKFSDQLAFLDVGKIEYSQYLTIFETFINIKAVASIFSEIDNFQPHAEVSKNPLGYEYATLLGRLLRLSPMQSLSYNFYFGEVVTNLSPQQVSNAYQAIQSDYKVLLDRQFFIIDKLVRGSVKTRESLMKWFATIVNHNHLRRGTYSDFNKLSSDGFMFNISYILMKLSFPFLDYPNYTKVNKIDKAYFGKLGNLIAIEEESRVNSTIEDANEYYSKQNDTKTLPTNFISDCFYLSLAYLHYGIGGIFIQYDKQKSQLKQLEPRLMSLLRELVRTDLNPVMKPMLEKQAKELTNFISKIKCANHVVQSIFGYKQFQLEIFDFIIGSTNFLTRVLSNDDNVKEIEIPLFKIDNVSQLDDQEFLRTNAPVPWKYFPEFIIEGVINYSVFSSRFNGCPLFENDSGKVSMFIEFTIILLRCPELLSNPHLKSNLIEVLYIGCVPNQGRGSGFLLPILNTNRLSVNNLLYLLLDNYVMVEKTGASSQFYDKFNSRYYISVIIEELWENSIYRKKLEDYSKNNVDFFVRFVARMLNDTTYLLDETFNELNSIHKYQKEIRRRAIGETDEELGTDKEIEEKLAKSESIAKSYMGLTNKTLELFKLFTKEVPKGFVLLEIVDRLASMLNYNLKALVGPKCSNLKVDDPTKYDFNPRRTLSYLCEIYINLSHEDKFITAVARDGRSFDPQSFARAESILSTYVISTDNLLAHLKNFKEKAIARKVLDDDEELELGEIPDEYLDPLMYTLMEDPVILPSSKISIDRSTIKAHLLSDPTDPFNRMPLKIDDIVDDVELREKIQQYKNEKRAQARG